MSAIPPSRWVWCGYAGHLIVAKKCRFHLSTRVGDYRISTVGDYWPDGATAPEEIGVGRLYETFVFRVSGPGEGEPDDYDEIDSEVYNDSEDADAGHMAMCRKYARA